MYNSGSSKKMESAGLQRKAALPKRAHKLAKKKGGGRYRHLTVSSLK